MSKDNFCKKAMFYLIGLMLLSDAAFADCADTKTTCIEDGGTRYFDGVSVTLPCWKYQIDRQCGSITDDNCKQLRAQKCVQICSKCRTMLENVCTVQDETYNCPVEQCKDTDGIVCGGAFYCMNGDCSQTDPSKNKDFDKAVAGMAAVGSAAADIKDTGGVKAFTGKALECSEDMIGFKNCCDRSGWGLDLIAHCDDDEKKLYQDRNKNLTVNVGEYCAHRDPILHICLSHHQVDCSFGSKLAKIVQDQGRKGQLHIPFGEVGGDDSHPDCRGITPDELSKLDFGKMDFQEVYQDIKDRLNLPDKSTTEGKLAERIKEFYDQHKKHS